MSAGFEKMVPIIVLVLLQGVGCGSSTGNTQICVADQGCPAAVQPEACSSEPEEVLELDAAHAGAAELAGQVVTVRGHLTRVGNACTRLGCGEAACCNQCDGHLALAGAAVEQLSSPLPTHLLLGDEGEPQSLCAGDDTGQCCYYVVGGPAVLVTGTLAEAPGTTAGVRLSLESLCAP